MSYKIGYDTDTTTYSTALSYAINNLAGASGRPDVYSTSWLAFSQNPMSVASYNIQVDSGKNTDGVYYVYAWCQNEARTWRPVEPPTQITLDTTKPGAPTNVKTARTPINVKRPTWTWTEPSDGAGTGLATTGAYRVMFQNLDSGTNYGPYFVDTASYTPSADWADGNYSLWVFARDKAGNESVASVAGDVKVDTLPPQNVSLTVAGKDNSGWTNSTAFVVSYIQTGAAKMRYNTDGGAYSAYTAVAGSSGTYTYPTATLAEGAHTLCVIMQDAAENEAPAACIASPLHQLRQDGADDRRAERPGPDQQHPSDLHLDGP